MLTYCNTARGRIACGLGGVLVAVLALACLWAFSPSVTAGEDLLPAVPQRPKEPSKPIICPKVADIPMIPVGETKSGRDAAPLPPPPPMTPGIIGAKEVGVVPPPSAPPLPPKTESSSVPPPLAPENGVKHVGAKSPVETDKPLAPPPPIMDTPPLPPAGPITQVSGIGSNSPVTQPVPQTQPPVDTQDIKQLVAHLTEIRADRAKLDDKERQTILTIKRKYQEQKQALEQMERELRQLGINFDETAPPPPPAR